jgi:AcrR family transcriptional regulator
MRVRRAASLAAGEPLRPPASPAFPARHLHPFPPGPGSATDRPPADVALRAGKKLLNGRSNNLALYLNMWLGLNMPIRKTKENLTDVVAVASEMFALHGYQQTTIASIAKKANVASGTVIYHFKSKNNLLFYIIWDLSNAIGNFMHGAAPFAARQDSAERVAVELIDLVLERRHQCVIAFKYFPEALANHEDSALLGSAFLSLRQSRARLGELLDAFKGGKADEAEDADTFVAILLGFVWLLLFADLDRAEVQAKLTMHLARLRNGPETAPS